MSAEGALGRALPLLRPDERARGRMVSGYFDLLEPDPVRSTGRAQDLMLTGLVPKVYERWWRPALGRVAKGVFGPGMADEHRIARLLLGLSPGDGVLDVACGTGNFTRDFGRSVGEDGLVVGIDVSQTMLARAVSDTRSAGLDNVAYVRGNAQELPFVDHSFDGVCCFAALPPVLGSDAGARPHDRGAHARRPHRAVHEHARPLGPGADGRVPDRSW